MSEKDFNLLFSRNLRKYMEQNNETQADVAKIVGVSTATVSNWCNGIKTPRMDKVDKLCLHYNIRRSNFLDDKSEQEDTYYIDDDAREVAEFLHKNPDYKVLFDASRKVKKEDIDFVKQMLDRFTE